MVQYATVRELVSMNSVLLAAIERHGEPKDTVVRCRSADPSRDALIFE